MPTKAPRNLNANIKHNLIVAGLWTSEEAEKKGAFNIYDPKHVMALFTSLDVAWKKLQDINPLYAVLWGRPGKKHLCSTVHNLSKSLKGTLREAKVDKAFGSFTTAVRETITLEGDSSWGGEPDRTIRRILKEFVTDVLNDPLAPVESIETSDGHKSLWQGVKTFCSSIRFSGRCSSNSDRYTKETRDKCGVDREQLLTGNGSGISLDTVRPPSMEEAGGGQHGIEIPYNGRRSSVGTNESNNDAWSSIHSNDSQELRQA